MGIAFAIGKFLLGGFGLIKDAAIALFGWAKDHPAQAALIAALLGLWWQTSALQGVRKDLVAMERAKDAEKASHRATKANYRHAQAEAAEQDRQNVERVKREHAAALKNVENEYANGLSRARSDLAGRLRSSPTRTCVASSGGGTELPAISRDTGNAGGRGQEAIVDVDDVNICTDNTTRLESLIQAWQNVAAVRVNQ